jgi:methionyl-tRNA formyltransferase
MIPHELSPRKIKLPETDHHSIVLITGVSLRHQRFGYLLQKEFSDLFLAWFQVGRLRDFSHTKSYIEKLRILWEKGKRKFSAGHEIEAIRDYVKNKGFIKSIKNGFVSVLPALSTIYLLHKRRRRQLYWDKTFFEQEIEELRPYAKWGPTVIEDPHSEKFIQRIKELDPYFLLSAGGPLYSEKLLESVRGVAINQHAGYSPKYKGSNAVEWALYSRDLYGVGSTVHITTSGADAGPILRRSHPCLLDSDTPESCFVKVFKLGNELAVEVVKDIMLNEEILVYDQSAGSGITYLGAQLDKNILGTIYRDFSKKWLKKELARLKTF